MSIVSRSAPTSPSTSTAASIRRCRRRAASSLRVSIEYLRGTRLILHADVSARACRHAGDHAELLAPALEVLQDRAADVSGGRGDNDHRSSPGCSVTDIAMLYISIDYRYTDLVAS